MLSLSVVRVGPGPALSVLYSLPLLSPSSLALSSSQPADCRTLIEKLKGCRDEQLLLELQHIKTWNIGKVSRREIPVGGRDT